jgi:hypothetical protein
LEDHLATSDESIPTPPSYAKLCLETGLYTPIELDGERDAAWLAQLRDGEVMFDAHCVECGRSATFRTFREVTDTFRETLMQRHSPTTGIRRTALARLQRLAFDTGQFGLHLACQRHGHLFSVFFELNSNEIKKIGQRPSIEDVASEETDRLRPVLGKYYGEMRRAGGLFSHGIGIGSFVYLRRVFESLIEEHRVAAEADAGPIAEYDSMRMDERVAALKHRLPKAVVEHAQAYSILSKGIHELSETECLLYFPILRRAILMMLEQAHEARVRGMEEEKMKKDMQAINATLKAR